MASEQGAGKREEAAVLERARDFRRNWRNRDEHAWGDSEVAAFALSEIARAKRETMEECCKLACHDCVLGVPLATNNCEIGHTLGGRYHSCSASAISRRMAEMEGK